MVEYTVVLSDLEAQALIEWAKDNCDEPVELIRFAVRMALEPLGYRLDDESHDAQDDEDDENIPF